MKTLKDIPAYGPDLLNELAKLIPPEVQKDAAHNPQHPSKSSNSRNKRTDLGRLDVEKYLNAYNIEFNVKSAGQKTLYRLSACLFDMSHTKNEAAIVQDAGGLIT